MIFSEEMIGGQEKVTTNEERVLRGVEQRSDTRKKFIFNAFVDLKPV